MTFNWIIYNKINEIYNKSFNTSDLLSKMFYYELIINYIKKLNLNTYKLNNIFYKQLIDKLEETKNYAVIYELLYKKIV